MILYTFSNYINQPWAIGGITNFKYDNACRLHSSLISHNQLHLLPSSLCIPIGHALTHVQSCQILRNPMRVEGNGMAAGEEIETLWSRMLRIWPKLKEVS